MPPLAAGRRMTTKLRQGLPSTRDWDRHPASFDKLRMRVFLPATKIFPHPELVEGRRVAMQSEVQVHYAADSLFSMKSGGMSGPQQ